MKPSKAVFLGSQASLVALGLAVALPSWAGRVDDALANHDTRLQRLESLLEGEVGLPQMLLRLDSLEQENRALRGRLEELNYKLEQVNQRQKDLYLDHDKRLQQLESRGAQPAGGGVSHDTATPGAAAHGGAPAPEAGQLDEQTQYRQAFDLLKNGQYDASAQSFVQFIQNFPNSTLVQNAQYWLGEAYYGAGKYDQAAKEFEKVRANYPNSPKIPDASLKLGYSYYELKNWSSARTVLKEIVQNFPGSTVAKLADERLRRMQREGH